MEIISLMLTSLSLVLLAEISSSTIADKLDYWLNKLHRLIYVSGSSFIGFISEIIAINCSMQRDNEDTIRSFTCEINDSKTPTVFTSNERVN